MDNKDKKPNKINPIVPPLIAGALEVCSVVVGFASMLVSGVAETILLLFAFLMPVAGLIISIVSFKSKNRTSLSYALSLTFILLPIPLLFIVSAYCGLLLMIAAYM